MNARVSIITVVFNRKSELEKTIQSVISQTYTDIDYIIIDGGSTDGTQDIIKKYGKKISFWVSEKDNGIYDAMNKGMKYAKGDYVWFLNAGDKIFSENTLKEIMESGDDADVLYGDVEIIDDSGKSYGRRELKTPPEKLTWKNMIDGMVVSHQSLLIRKDIACDYDLKYKYVADIDWAIRVLKKSRKTVNTNRILSSFLIGGFSRKNTIASLKERYRMLCTHFNPVLVTLNHIKLSYKFIVYIIKRRKLL